MLKFFNLLKKKSSRQIALSKAEQELIESLYIHQKAHNKSLKLEKELEEKLIYEEMDQLVTLIKHYLSYYLSDENYTQIALKQRIEFITFLKKKRIIFQIKKIENKNHQLIIYQALSRIIYLDELKKEAKQTSDIDNYFNLLANLKASSHIISHLFYSLQKINKYFELLIENMLSNNDLSIELCFHEYSQKLSTFLQEEFLLLKNNLNMKEAPYIFRVEVGQKDVDLEIKKLQNYIKLLDQDEFEKVYVAHQSYERSKS